MEKVSGYESDAIHRSVGPGLYQTNNLKNAEVYPWAPTMILQKNGGSVDKENVKDIESDLFNIGRKLSKDPNKKFVETKEEKYNFLRLKDGLFHQESTLLSSPPIVLKGQTKNRWTNLYLNPQDNVIESFDRLGTNTHLSLVDNFKPC